MMLATLANFMGNLIYATHMTHKDVSILFKRLSYVVKISSMQTI